MALGPVGPKLWVGLLPVDLEGHLLLVLLLHVVLAHHHPHVRHVVDCGEAVLGGEDEKIGNQGSAAKVLEASAIISHLKMEQEFKLDTSFFPATCSWRVLPTSQCLSQDRKRLTHIG